MSEASLLKWEDIRPCTLQEKKKSQSIFSSMTTMRISKKRVSAREKTCMLNTYIPSNHAGSLKSSMENRALSSGEDTNFNRGAAEADIYFLPTGNITCTPSNPPKIISKRRQQNPQTNQFSFRWKLGRNSRGDKWYVVTSSYLVTSPLEIVKKEWLKCLSNLIKMDCKDY